MKDRVFSVLIAITAAVGLPMPANATDYPDGYLGFTLAVPSTWEYDLVSSLIADPRYRGSNCVDPPERIVGNARKKFLPPPYKKGQTHRSIANTYTVISIRCETDVNDLIFALIGEKSMAMAKAHGDEQARITVSLMTAPAGPTGCFPRSCAGDLRKSLQVCGPLCS